MGKRLGEGVNYVYLDEFGEPQTLMAGDEVPADVAKGLGDHMFEGYVPPARRSDRAPAAAASAPAASGGEVPPMGGAGSGADAWRQYAEGLGVEVEDGASRDEIVALLDAGGHPTTRE